MKLGLMTAALPRLSLEQVATWAGRQRVRDDRGRLLALGGRRQRRYAGVSHIDVDALDVDRGARDARPARASRSRRSPTTRTTCTRIRRDRKAANAHLRKVIDAAATLEVPIVGTFVGTGPAQHARPTTSRSSARSGRGSSTMPARAGVKHRDRELPDALQLTTSGRAAPTSRRTPAIWDEMFSIIPSRELRAQPRSVAPRVADDRLRARRARLRPRILHVHAKDMEIDREGL